MMDEQEVPQTWDDVLKWMDNAAKLARWVRRAMPVINRFVRNFEGVFQDDWEHTKGCLGLDDSAGADLLMHAFILPNRDFLSPGVEDEANNWCSRGALLASYREVREILDEAEGKW